MNGIQNRKCQNIEKFPGCLGRMVNLFDLNTGVPGNRLLTDKPHQNGSSLSGIHSDVVRMPSPTFGDIEDKAIVSELRRALSNKKGNGTPMKMLIAQEMSKEMESMQNPPNVVAKLMGLDALPRQHNLVAQRCHSKGSSRHSLSDYDIKVEGLVQDQDFSQKQMQCEVKSCQDLNKYKDVHEIWQQSPTMTYSRDSSPQKGRYDDNVNEKKMALARQKFMETNHPVTNENLRQTKEFHDALDVLSSSRDLFLKILEEPNSTFSQHHLYSVQSLSQPPDTKRITVLRPSKMGNKEKSAGIGKKGGKNTKKPSKMGQISGWDRNSTSCSPVFPGPRVDEYPPQPTRIVVLKPSPGKTQDIKTLATPFTSSPRILHDENFCDEHEEDGARESREVAKRVNRQMREDLMGHRRGETLLSSVFSNGYIGDDSSFNRSENEYGAGNLSDSEVLSPTSKHSWDYIDRLDSPSSSSFSRASCSSESSVCREAKKRLSERWAMMALSESSQEQSHVRRSSSTLGEMLALSDTKKFGRSEENGSYVEQKCRGSTSCISSNLNKEESTSDSPQNLLRSKSVPVSSTVYGARLNMEVSNPVASKDQVPKELTKAKSMKSSIKGKVSSLFFSKNKKTNKEKSNGSQLTDESPSVTSGTPDSPIICPQMISNDASQCINGSFDQEVLSPVLGGSASKTPLLYFTGMGQKQDMISVEGGLSVAKPSMPVHISENLDQPSPISVLEPPFEEDENTISLSSGSMKPVHGGLEVPNKSNLIDKSPPIESIARTLSWDDSCLETGTLYPSKLSPVSPCAKEEEQDWAFSIQSLLSAAGLNGELGFESLIARWHSPESPLDSSLRDKYANFNEKEPVHEPKRRQWRSNRKLVFDSVNAALLEITGYGYGHRSGSCIRGISVGRGSQMMNMEGALPSPMLADQVWAQMMEWFCDEVKCLAGDDGDMNSLVVERVVWREVVGKGWVDQMKLEIDNWGREIEGNLLQELVEEAVLDLTAQGRLAVRC